MARARDKGELRRNWAFMFNATGFALILLALAFEYEPYVDFDNPHMNEIKAIEKTVVRVLPKKIPSLLQAEDGKPVMLVFYASWCSYCAQLMPRILELIDEHKLDHVKPVFISMDSQLRIYSKYLFKTKYYEKFKPVMLQEIFYNNLPDVMSTTGSHFGGAIPYVGFFNSRGKMVAEIAGLVDKQGLLKVAESVQ